MLLSCGSQFTGISKLRKGFPRWICRQGFASRLGGLQRAQLSTSIKEPLRILFCGSESYSVACLEALHAEAVSHPQDIASIDVVCRPGKPVGRGYKQIRHPPIRDEAIKLGLQLHEIDTFTRWTPPSFPTAPFDINLIVAVSFGLFVPPRLLKAAKYGGINVHPSLLPEFRGSAPLQWTLLAHDTHTGVTVQTLHHEKFDHGTILKQTAKPGLPIPPESNYNDLLEIVKPESVRLFIDVIRNRLFEIKNTDQEVNSTVSSDLSSLRTAPKITPEHRHVDWRNWSATELLSRQTVLGRLWTIYTPTTSERGISKPKTVRIILEGISKEPGLILKPQADIPVGVPYIIASPSQSKTKSGGLLVNTSDGSTVFISTMKIEGHKSRPAFEAAWNHGMMVSRQLNDHSTLFSFQQSLD